MVVGYCCGSPVYAKLCKEGHNPITYKESVVPLYAKSFSKWANEVEKKIMNMVGVDYRKGKVPVPFCAMLLVNATRYFPGSLLLRTNS